MPKKSSLKILYLHIDNENWLEEDAHLYATVPTFVANRLSIKPSKKRWQSLKGWWLLSKALGVSLNELPAVYFGDKGKPYFEKGPFFNISNTKDLVVVAIGDETCEVGIDIEKIRQPRPLIYPKVFTDEERLLITDAEEFTEMWTRKEAVVKLFGGGISMGLLKFNVLSNIVHAFNSEVYLHPIAISGFKGALATFTPLLTIDMIKL